MIALPLPSAGDQLEQPRVSRAVSDVVGSSKMMRRASTCSALATSTSCRSPGKALDQRVGRRARPTRPAAPRDRVGDRRRGQSARRAAGKRLMKMFSAIVRLVKRLSSWWMKAMPAALGSRGLAGA